jgi:ribosomal protein S18 acetylase RimI-like enzyme
VDIPVVARLLELGFGDPADDVADRLASPGEHTLVIELSGSAVGTMRVIRDGNDAAIYGFVIDPTQQGRGLGREALRRVCEELRADGVHHVRLEVAVENDRALRLYTSLGFTPVATEDYYALPGVNSPDGG